MNLVEKCCLLEIQGSLFSLSSTISANIAVIFIHTLLSSWLDQQKHRHWLNAHKFFNLCMAHIYNSLEPCDDELIKIYKFSASLSVCFLCLLFIYFSIILFAAMNRDHFCKNNKISSHCVTDDGGDVRHYDERKWLKKIHSRNSLL